MALTKVDVIPFNPYCLLHKAWAHDLFNFLLLHFLFIGSSLHDSQANDDPINRKAGKSLHKNPFMHLYVERILHDDFLPWADEKRVHCRTARVFILMWNLYRQKKSTHFLPNFVVSFALNHSYEEKSKRVFCNMSQTLSLHVTWPFTCFQSISCGLVVSICITVMLVLLNAAYTLVNSAGFCITGPSQQQEVENLRAGWHSFTFFLHQQCSQSVAVWGHHDFCVSARRSTHLLSLDLLPCSYNLRHQFSEINEL